MTTHHFQRIDGELFEATRNAVHAYSRVLGNVQKACRPKRKHWWHASLRPSLNGLTTGVVRTSIGFDIELNLRKSVLELRASSGEQLDEKLRGQPAFMLAEAVNDFLIASGVDRKLILESGQTVDNTERFDGYSTEQARIIARVMNSVTAALETFRAGIREETSPIQLWPHHFDLSMLWLPGEKIEGQDPENEEYSDKQMNFGFTFGDEGIPEPYFYVTAYPLPDGFQSLRLPAGTNWQTDGFSGAVLLYQSLTESSDPNGYLLSLWNTLLSAGHDQMLANAT